VNTAAPFIVFAAFVAIFWRPFAAFVALVATGWVARRR
jgi:hypothetical protein